jgi:protein ImuB
MAFAEPLMEPAGLAHALERLLADLAVVLEGAGQGARRLALAAYGADASVSRIAIGTGAPSRDPAHLMFLFRERLERIDLQYGIDLLILNAERVDTLAPVQQSMIGNHGITGAFAGQDTAPLVAPLIDRLANRLGTANVGHSRPRASHLPERAERRVAALSEPLSASQGKFAVSPGGGGGGNARPFRLFARPEPLEVVAEVPEGPPLTFRWRRMNIRVLRAEGPERIAPEWWLDNSSCDAGGCCGGGLRDYYRIEDAAGRRFWVYRAGLYGEAGQNGPPRWYMHGLFA